MGTLDVVVHVAIRSRFVWPDVNCKRCGVKLLSDMLSVRDEKAFVFTNLPPNHVWCEKT
jgi:uncharacterized radical SAM superfamily protein